MTDHTDPTAPTPDTPDTPADSPAMDPGLTPPPEVQALLDEASIPGGPYSAAPTATAVHLVDTRTRHVIYTVQWPRAGEWARNILMNSMAATRDLPPPQETPPNV